MAFQLVPDTLRRVFLEAFTARDIAEPLASFDANAPSGDVRAFMEARHVAVVGIRSEGRIAGYVERSSLNECSCGECRRPIEEAAIVSDATPLLSVLRMLNQASFLLVSVFGTVGGVITREDLQKPPVRMWLFGIVTLIEMRCSELIEEHCPGETWRTYLSEARLQKAQALLVERCRRNQSLRLFDCLQFSDKGQIMARDEVLRQRTAFTSRRQADEAVKNLEQLRNNLAHAQDIVTSDWETILRLCDFLTGQ